MHSFPFSGQAPRAPGTPPSLTTLDKGKLRSAVAPKGQPSLREASGRRRAGFHQVELEPTSRQQTAPSPHDFSAWLFLLAQAGAGNPSRVEDGPVHKSPEGTSIGRTQARASPGNAGRAMEAHAQSVARERSIDVGTGDGQSGGATEPHPSGAKALARPGGVAPEAEPSLLGTAGAGRETPASGVRANASAKEDGRSESPLGRAEATGQQPAQSVAQRNPAEQDWAQGARSHVDSPRVGVTSAPWGSGKDTAGKPTQRQHADMTGEDQLTPRSHGEVGPSNQSAPTAGRPSAAGFAAALGGQLDASPSASGRIDAAPSQMTSQPVVQLAHPLASRQLAEVVHRQVAQGAATLEVSVRPEGLGPLSVTVSETGNGVAVQITAAHPATVSWLHQQSAALTHALQDAGVQLSGLQVGFGSNSSSSGAGGAGGGSDRERERSAKWRTAAEVTAAPGQALAGPDAGGLGAWMSGQSIGFVARA
ncbi:flagellar hook-length control protein FliK [Alicyclobacillus kakegawensis]|uniref:flagellar hook-length control protein FliK n=1 Tax=Alicyclobacillus kakegawensis TaxID=392012 RepID=UPI001FE14D2E|nr:flagellar hook-length control protein FliK [Alicyclobacillus kakegawensis]